MLLPSQHLPVSATGVTVPCNHRFCSYFSKDLATERQVAQFSPPTMIHTIIFTPFPSQLHRLRERGEGGAARGGGGGDAGLLAAREPADPVLAQRRARGACKDRARDRSAARGCTHAEPWQARESGTSGTHCAALALADTWSWPSWPQHPDAAKGMGLSSYGAVMARIGRQNCTCPSVL